jgi:hypothetical protein
LPRRKVNETGPIAGKVNLTQEAGGPLNINL